jgi:hypothetical protein
MKRRELIKALAGTFTIIASSSALADVVVNYRGQEGAQALAPDQLNTLAKLVDCVIPDTDTPGASAAGVHHFIDYMLANWHGPKETGEFVAGMTALESQCVQINGDGLTATTPLAITSLLTSLEQQQDQSAARNFALWLKEFTVLGYYTSEIGASQELQYLAIPGSYSSCIDFEDGQRTWAT